MIIGFAGKKGSGKDFAGQYLIKKYDYRKYAFADNLKKGIQEIFFLEDDQLWGESKEIDDKFWGVSPRKLMQTIGTEIFRDSLHKYFKCNWEEGNFWVKCFQKWYLKNEGNVVITDVRFPEEVFMIQRMGGIIIYIERDGLIYDDHSSENFDIKNISNHIIKNCDKDKLYNDIENIIMGRECKEVYC